MGGLIGDGAERRILEGVEYGLPPVRMLLSGLDQDSWKDAQCEAIAYTYLDYPGCGRIPAVALVFADFEKGRDVFKTLIDWGNGESSECGVDFTVNASRALNRYILGIHPSADEMIKRMSTEETRENYTMMTMGYSIGKEIMIRAGYDEIKSTFTSENIAFLPAGFNEGPDDSLAIVTGGVVFNELGDSDEFEMSMSHLDGLNRNKKYGIEEITVIKERRLKLLDKFHEVKIRRLMNNQSFCSILLELGHQFEESQVLQAACNLISKVQVTSKVGKDEVQGDFNFIYDYISSNPEDSCCPMALDYEFTLAEITGQIDRDIKVAAFSIAPTLSGDPIDKLKEVGLL